jgi:hypothetical protein
MNTELEKQLIAKLNEYAKLKHVSLRKILSNYRIYKNRKHLKRNLKVLLKRIEIWRKLFVRETLKLQKYGFARTKEIVNKQKEE